MKRLLLPLLAALALPTQVEAAFVLPWNKIEPTTYSLDSAMKECAINNERLKKVGHYKDLLETDIREQYINGKKYRWVREVEILTTECQEHETSDPNIGEIRGKVFYRQTGFENGKMIEYPKVHQWFFIYDVPLYYRY